MKTSHFDACVDFIPSDLGRVFKGLLLIKGMKLPISLYFYRPSKEKTLNQFFVCIHSHKLLSLKWKDRFKVCRENECLLGEGKVLNPFSEITSPRKAKRKIAFLQKLMGDEKEMLLALVLEKGIRGLKEREVSDFSPLTKASCLRLSQELETESKVKILSFAPLFLISLDGFEFLCKKIVAFLKQFQKKHLEYEAPSLEKIRRRFDLHPRIFSLALGHLLRSGQIKQSRNGFELSDFSPTITSEEKEILKQLEDMCYKGEFRSISVDDLQKRFRLSSKMLDKMLSILVEKRKIIHGKDGFLLHSRWLEELIWRIRKSGSKELTIANFKEMTGLSRKYAIPLLELLDQLGVTRRRGAIREIL